MRASVWEYRLRVPLAVLILLVGYLPFWEPWLGLTTKSTWLSASAIFARQGWLNFQAATTALLLIAILLTGLGALLRVWGSAYLRPEIVSAPNMQTTGLLTDGPYRRTRNPLFLGTLLHAVGLSILMPPAGAVFAVAAIWILQLRLAAAEEPYLLEQYAGEYATYKVRVPQFLPSPKPQVAPTGHQPHWLPALAGESYMIGVVITLLGFGWDFNAQPLIRGILISLGISLVLQALLPRVPRATSATA